MNDATERPTDAEIDILLYHLWVVYREHHRRVVRDWLAPIVAAEVERAVAERAGPLADSGGGGGD
jgi:hypothetical protein